jgi:hypothetical protein
MDTRFSGSINDPYKIIFMVWGVSVAGGVGFEPTTTGLGGLRPIRTRLPAQHSPKDAKFYNNNAQTHLANTKEHPLPKKP